MKTNRHWLMLSLLCGTLLVAPILAPLTAPAYGVEVEDEEWYDPSDWFDGDEVEYEYEDDYDDYDDDYYYDDDYDDGYYYDGDYYTDEWGDDGDFAEWWDD